MDYLSNLNLYCLVPNTSLSEEPLKLLQETSGFCGAEGKNQKHCPSGWVYSVHPEPCFKTA